MFSIVVACFFTATGIMVYRIKEAADLSDWRAVWLRGAVILPLAVAIGAACWAVTCYPTLASARPPVMGIGWDCVYYGKGAKICFKVQKK